MEALLLYGLLKACSLYGPWLQIVAGWLSFFAPLRSGFAGFSSVGVRYAYVVVGASLGETRSSFGYCLFTLE
jgi:hypothetical protein